jgi:TP901 family phage tail tape measure protein
MRSAPRSDETGPALDALIERAKENRPDPRPAVRVFRHTSGGRYQGTDCSGLFPVLKRWTRSRETLALAAMEGIEVSQAAVLMSDAIAQFGLKAKDASAVAGILAKAAGAVAATAVDMGEALKYSGAAASSAGLSLTQTAAVLDVLGKAGQRGSEAGTGLASVLSILANPAHTATQALFDLGATSTELGDVLDFIQKQGLGAADIIGKFGEQGGRVINTLIAQGGTKAIQGFCRADRRNRQDR